MITRQDVATRLIDYLNHHLTLEELVHWAEDAMMEGDLDDQDVEVLRDVLARIGLADVKEFGLSWENWEEFLSRLGYQVQVQVSKSR
ncbi:MAG: hypothetical protein HZA19_05050 [Nitrospirae bacterium]|nr:hypothetical protein [Nitrospirota bacterium]